jgi:hypothetical protein
MSNFIPHQDNLDEKVMWEHDYEELKRKEKIAQREAEARKKIDDELKREATKERNKEKDKINYSESLAQEICERVSAGELLINICNDYHMPTIRRCNQWLKNNSDFTQLYKESINDRLNIFEEEVIKIADEAAFDLREITRRDKKITQVDTEVIARAKLRVEVRFRHLKAGRPQKWADTSTLTVRDDETAQIDNMTLEDLEKKIADIELKNNIVKGT